MGISKEKTRHMKVSLNIKLWSKQIEKLCHLRGYTSFHDVLNNLKFPVSDFHKLTIMVFGILFWVFAEEV